MEEFIIELESWAKTVMVSLILGGQSTEHTDDIRRVVEVVTKVRQLHDETAKTQGNPTVRKVREDSGKGKAEITEEEAAAKAAALIG